MKAISKFSGQYGFLSNFSPDQVFINGIYYLTMEHYFQASKAALGSEREFVASADTPIIAKRRGRSVKLRPDWESIKLDIMRNGLAAKFKRGSDLAEMLVGTGNAHLIEGNGWNDVYWGCVWQDGKWVGRNWLGWLLMAQRGYLRSK